MQALSSSERMVKQHLQAALEAWQAGAEERAGLQQKLEQAERQLELAQSDCRQKAAEHAESEAQLQACRQSCGALKRQLQALQSTLEAERAAHEGDSLKLAQLHQQLDEMQQALQAKMIDAARQQSAHSSLQQQVTELQRQLEAAHSSQDKLQQQLQNTQTQLRQEQVARVPAHAATNADSLQDITQQQSQQQSQHQVEALKAQVTQLADMNSLLEVKTAALVQQLEVAKSQIIHLSKQLAQANRQPLQEQQPLQQQPPDLLQQQLQASQEKVVHLSQQLAQQQQQMEQMAQQLSQQERSQQQQVRQEQADKPESLGRHTKEYYKEKAKSYKLKAEQYEQMLRKQGLGQNKQQQQQQQQHTNCHHQQQQRRATSSANPQPLVSDGGNGAQRRSMPAAVAVYTAADAAARLQAAAAHASGPGTKRPAQAAAASVPAAVDAIPAQARGQAHAVGQDAAAAPTAEPPFVQVGATPVAAADVHAAAGAGAPHHLSFAQVDGEAPDAHVLPEAAALVAAAGETEVGPGSEQEKDLTQLTPPMSSKRAKLQHAPGQHQQEQQHDGQVAAWQQWQRQDEQQGQEQEQQQLNRLAPASPASGRAGIAQPAAAECLSSPEVESARPLKLKQQAKGKKQKQHVQPLCQGHEEEQAQPQQLQQEQAQPLYVLKRPAEQQRRKRERSASSGEHGRPHGQQVKHHPTHRHSLQQKSPGKDHQQQQRQHQQAPLQPAKEQQQQQQSLPEHAVEVKFPRHVPSCSDDPNYLQDKHQPLHQHHQHRGLGSHKSLSPKQAAAARIIAAATAVAAGGSGSPAWRRKHAAGMDTQHAGTTGSGSGGHARTQLFGGAATHSPRGSRKAAGVPSGVVHAAAREAANGSVVPVFENGSKLQPAFSNAGGRDPLEHEDLGPAAEQQQQLKMQQRRPQQHPRQPHNHQPQQQQQTEVSNERSLGGRARQQEQRQQQLSLHPAGSGGGPAAKQLPNLTAAAVTSTARASVANNPVTAAAGGTIAAALAAAPTSAAGVGNQAPTSAAGIGNQPVVTNKQQPSSAAVAALPAGQQPAREPGYKYVEVVRKKADRELLPAFECAQCRSFYTALSSWGGGAEALPLPGCDHAGLASDAAAVAGIRVGPAATEQPAVAQHPQPQQLMEQLVQQNGRHRARWQPPATPQGFWNIGFDSLGTAEVPQT